MMPLQQAALRNVVDQSVNVEEKCCWAIGECSPQLELLRSEWVSALLTSSLLSWLSLLCLLLPTLLTLLLLASVFDALLYWCWCSLLLTSPLLSSTSSLNSLLIRLTIANCSSTVCISPLFLILAWRCVLKIGLFLRPRFLLQISSSRQWVVVVIYNQMQTHHCCGFLELFTAAKNCHEGPRRATGQKETVEMRGHEFCYSKCRSLSQMNAGNERTPPPEQALCALLLPSTVLAPCAS